MSISSSTPTQTSSTAQSGVPPALCPTPSHAPKPLFVPPRLTKQGRVASITQQDAGSDDIDPNEPP